MSDISPRELAASLAGLIYHSRHALSQAFLFILLCCLPLLIWIDLQKAAWDLASLSFVFGKAALYASVFALILLAIALLLNYGSILEQFRIWQYPAFNTLPIIDRYFGHRRIWQKLNSYLVTRIEGQVIRLKIEEINRQGVLLEVSPQLRDIALISKLKKELNTQKMIVVKEHMRLSWVELQDENSVVRPLKALCEKLRLAASYIDDLN